MTPEARLAGVCLLHASTFVCDRKSPSQGFISQLGVLPLPEGCGRKLFAEGTRYVSFALVESSTSPSGAFKTDPEDDFELAY